ncbi:MAG: hypothetical protein AB1666_02560 [Pseudomonadota bacterium]|uniref:Uncharacterized protein n=1 Tax=Caldimonas aquatica TaxID=376175 RepID=A0ABY6MUW0_9BURK|nr:hypothetical protein [Schlegelella aquatica]UZD55779.1 hypothetical protein OMP39_04145 [Schlegelella aquatica]
MPDARRAAGPGKPLRERIATVNEREEIEETLADADEVERSVRAASRARPSPRVSNEDLPAASGGASEGDERSSPSR